MKEIGMAMAVSDGKVTVSVRRTAACAKCGKCGHAHVVFGDNSDLVFEALPAGDIKPGDTVEVEMDSGDVLKASFLIWTMPLVAVGAGYGIGALLGGAIGNSSLWGAVFALGAGALSYFWLHHYDESSRHAGKYLPLARALKDTQW